MKVCMFHLMPYRDLPARLRAALQVRIHRSIVVRRRRRRKGRSVLQRHPRRDAPCGESRHSTALCTNQHHQNVYGFMANPSLMGSVLAQSGPTARTSPSFSSARRCRRPRRRPASPRNTRCSIASAAAGSSPGFPTGLPTDATHLQRASCRSISASVIREALALVTKAWSAREIFAWNGKHYQLGMVNLWPRPIQQPHPPDLDSGLRHFLDGRICGRASTTASAISATTALKTPRR